MTICGTTDAPSDITMTPAPTAQDVQFIIEESNRYLNRKVTTKDVKAAWSGVRPLVKDPSLPNTGKATSQVSRKVRNMVFRYYAVCYVGPLQLRLLDAACGGGVQD
jgi:glycerol-3-phosphate dehydrogenase